MPVTSPTFRRLLGSFLLLILLTSLILNASLTRDLAQGPLGTQPAMAALRWRILEAALLSAVAAAGLAYLYSRAFSRQVKRLREFAETLMEAGSADSARLAADGELSVLARSLQRTGAQLRELVSRLSLESTRREAILASMVEGVLAVDADLRVTFCNDSFLRLLGRPGGLPEASALQGVPLLDLVRDPEFVSMVSTVLETGEARTKRLQLAGSGFPGAGGTEGRWFEVHAAKLADGARPGALAILHDITDLERLERVRKDFVANVSHELRTPLTAIRGYAETLLEGALDDQENNRKFVEVIRAHAIRLNNIAADLLALSDLESRQPPAEPEVISVRAALEAALHTVEAEAQVRGVTLVCGAVEDCTVRGERLRFEQALVNLLDNAVKFNRAGGEVRVDAVRTAEGQVRIAIADTGIGIPSTDLGRIFERFYRVDKARSREVGGTGLGLSIVKHVIERMGGTVSVESRLGKGSTFTLLLPA